MTGCCWPQPWIDPERPRRQSTDIRARVADGTVDLVRVTPLVHQLPLNHALYYPVYATCEELGIPVSINIGIPGPRVRSRCQDPVLLEDVLIDFPDLVVIGAHMGHPYEELLIEYMLKWPNLYLSNSAYLAKYMHPALVTFMGSRRGPGRVLFASDHPFLPMERALAAARALPVERRGHGRLPRRGRRPGSSTTPLVADLLHRSAAADGGGLPGPDGLPEPRRRHIDHLRPVGAGVEPPGPGPPGPRGGQGRPGGHLPRGRPDPRLDRGLQRRAQGRGGRRCR